MKTAAALTLTSVIGTALFGIGCSSGGSSASYSADSGGRASSPYSYSGGSNRTGSSTATNRPSSNVAQAPRTVTPPPVARSSAPAVHPGDALPPYTPPKSVPPSAPAAEPSNAPVALERELPTSPQAFAWASTLSEAQRTARSTGRLIFLESGRDACGNCQKLRRETIPGISADLGSMCVGYYDDCDRDKGSQAFAVLQQNLPGAVMLPLVGWVTPDLKWVHGFSGSSDATKMRREMATARATYRRMAAVAPAANRAETLADAAPASDDAELVDATAELVRRGEPVMSAPRAVAGAAPVPTGTSSATRVADAAKAIVAPGETRR